MKNVSLFSVCYKLGEGFIARLLFAFLFIGALSVWGEGSASSNSPAVTTGSTLARAQTDSGSKETTPQLGESRKDLFPAATPDDTADANSNDTAPEPGMMPTPGAVRSANHQPSR